jgi:hypothetical protein
MTKEQWRKPYNLVNREDLRRRLEEYNRQPFGDVVAALLMCRPTMAEITKWAARNPEKWARAVEVFAKLQGFTEKREMNVNVFHSLERKSDAEIRALYEDLEREEQMLLNAQQQEPILIEDLAGGQPQEVPSWALESDDK